ncbi:MAG: hypothetical protein ABEJ73_06490 [Haloplanus sp.]
MALDVEVPEPPDLTNRSVPDGFEATDELGGPSEFHREDLEEILRDGAWQEAFREWAAYTDLTDQEYRTLREHGLLAELDIYWNPTEERLRFEVPPFPDDVGDEVAESLLRAELTDLGHAVVEMIEDAYWEGEPHWAEEVFDEEPTGG